MSRANPRQRERLLGAMARVAARHGYREASVARVIEQAGVSRATFYEQFADREECFVATYREASKRVRRETLRIASQGDRPPQPGEILRGVLVNAERDPTAARLVLIESLAGGPLVREEHEKLLGEIERSIESYLGGGLDGASRLQISPRALLGGISSVVAVRGFNGETGRLADLTDDLLTWIQTYVVSADQQQRPPVDWYQLGRRFATSFSPPAVARALSPPLPRGRNALPAGVVASEQRQRILDAVALLSREKGYAAMTVGDLAAAAHVTREVFYELFRGKEDAFLAAQALGLQESVARTAGEFFGAAAWPDRVWSGSQAMLGYMMEQPGLVFVNLVESYAAGAAAIRRTFDNQMAYTLFLEDGYRQRPEAEHLPHLCSEAIGGAILELMRRQVVDSGIARLMELVPQSVYVVLAPFIGPVAAIELVEAKVAEAGGTLMA